MVLHVFGYAIPHLIWRSFCADSHGKVGVPKQGMTIYLLGLGVGWLVSLIVVLWAADVWTREVEGRCVRFTKWMESVVFLKS